MKKDTLSIKTKASKLQSKDINSINLLSIFNYTSDAQLLSDILNLMYYEISNTNEKTHINSIKYLKTLVTCIEILAYRLDLISSSPEYQKIMVIQELIETKLKLKKRIGSILNKVSSDLDDIIYVLDSLEHDKRLGIQKYDEKRIVQIKEYAYKIVEYFLFNVHDIKLIIRINDENLLSAIKDNIELIVKRLCLEYVNDKKLRDYYKKLFIYLSSDQSFGLSDYYDYISEYMDDNLDDVELLEFNYIKNSISNSNSKVKYSIPNEINSVDVFIPDNDIADMTDRYIFTIDGLGAVYLDDAISFDVLPNHNYRIGLYIADISDIVIPNSIIDSYAYNMGETIYLGNSIPMLPAEIYKCSSLNKNKTTLVHAYEIEINDSYEIVNLSVKKAKICVKDNFTYSKIDDLIINGKDEFSDNLRKLDEYTTFLLNNNSRKKYYLEFKKMIDPSKKLRIEYGNNPSNRIISEIKTSINSYLAKQALKSNIPFIYRNNLYNKYSLDDTMKELLCDNLFANAKSIIESSYSSSFYSNECMGHYGLNLDAYAHATTPLRNYSSVFNQRMVSHYMIDDNEIDASLELLASDLSRYLNERYVLNKMYMHEVINKRKTLTK